MKTQPSPPHLKWLGGKFVLKYHLTVPHLLYGGTEARARVPPIALNRFSSFLKRGGGRDKPGAPTCQGRMRTEVGPGTEAAAKVPLIAEH